ncbi:MAG: serine protease [Chitinophagaceae bacterium]
MEELQLLDAVERYFRGEMSPEETAHFEQLRKTNPEVDQFVVEHTMFLHKVGQYSDWKGFKSTLNEVHNELLDSGEIREKAPKATVLQLWNKYKRVVAVAASIAGITAIATSVIAYYFTPRGTTSDIIQLSRKIDVLSTSQQRTHNELIDLKNKSEFAQPNAPAKVGGTGFLVDGKGYLITSAHVVANADSVYVQNQKGYYFKVSTLYINRQTDIAVLKITDNRFQPVKNLPYSIYKSSADLGEEVFTLGFPRPSSEIVYNRGYLSAQTGYNGDTLAYQLAISANPGNSGGPIFNHTGDVIGILSGKQITAEGVIFSSRSKNIYIALNEINKDTTNNEHVRLPNHHVPKDLDRVQLIERIKDCMFMVKSY